MSRENSSSGGVGLATVLVVVFAVLKLIGVEPVASWGWVWVLAPWWIAFVVFGGLALAVFAVASISDWWKLRQRMKWERESQ